MTAIYTTALAIGLTAAFTLTVPFSEALDHLVVAHRPGGLGGAGGPGGPAVVLAVAARPLRHADARPAGAGRLERRRPDAAGLDDGRLLRAPVDPGLRRVRVVRPAVPRQRLQRDHRGAAGRHPGRRQHPDLAAGAVAGGRRDDQRPSWRRWSSATPSVLGLGRVPRRPGLGVGAAARASEGRASPWR